MTETRRCEFCGTTMPSDQLVKIAGKSVCAACKPEVILNVKSGIGGGPRIAPEKAEEIRRRISRLNLLSFGLAVPGLLLMVAIPALSMAGLRPDSPSAVYGILRMLPLMLLIAGFSAYAQMKGRSWAYGLLGLLSCIGLLILALLGKQCQNCRQNAASRAKECKACGAPM